MKDYINLFHAIVSDIILNKQTYQKKTIISKFLKSLIYDDLLNILTNDDFYQKL